MKLSLTVKPFQETLGANMCGPASLKIIFGFYGLDKSERELARLCKVDSELGVNDETLKAVAQSFGFKVEIKNENSFEDIALWLEKGVPVIVDWFTRGRSDYSSEAVADGHYSVVCGLDDEYIYLQDPEIGGRRKLKRDDFMTVWFDFRGKFIKPEELIVRQLIAVYR